MTLRLNGDSSGFTEIKAADTAGDNSIKLPAANGSANQVLKNSSTAGELEYASNLYENGGNVIVGSNSYAFPKLLNVVSATGKQISISSESTTDGGADQGPGIEFKFHDGSQVREGGTILVHKVNATVGNAATQMIFRTRDSSAGMQDVMKLDNDGTLHLLDGSGIDFSGIQTNATGMTSERLDSYEEGTWTPTPNFGGGSAGITYQTSPVGYYTRVGRMVHVQYGFKMNNKGTSTGNFSVGGLPFNVAGTGSFLHSTASVNAHYLTSSNLIVGSLGNTTNQIDFRLLNDSTVDQSLNNTHFTNGVGFYSSMVYMTTS